MKVGDKIPTWFSGSPDGLSTVLDVVQGKGITYLRLTAFGTRRGWTEMTYTPDLEWHAVRELPLEWHAVRDLPKLVAETYVCSGKDGIEYGYCFKKPGSDDSEFDLVLGVLPNHGQNGQAIHDGYLKFKWAADAIVRAAP